jgi:hypothetical protein
MTRDRIVADLEALARSNPLYVWRTLAEECRPGEPLPVWIEDYLRNVACALLDMAEGEARWVPEPDRRPVTPGEAAKRTPQALGLTRVGWNAFADYRATQKDATLAFDYERQLQPGESEALVDLAARQLEQNRATVRRRIARARKRWDEQR